MLYRFLVLVALTCAATITVSAQDDVCVPLSPGSVAIRCDIPLVSDTLLYIENQNVTRILVNLNGYEFKLAADSAEVARSGNAFLIPREGAITINIGAYIRPDSNFIELSPQGPSDSRIPRIIIANILLAGQQVAYKVPPPCMMHPPQVEQCVPPLPQRLRLLYSYPNPFASSASLVYTIPADRTTGVPVRLAVYDARGRLVRVLVDERRYPGTFTAVWDGTGAHGAPVASGVYIAHFVGGDGMSGSVTLTHIP
jgi:hypothetical protein